jgi:tRNA G18 (ribose-2'-O)-methylase SpoU
VLIPLSSPHDLQDPRLADYANLTDAQLRVRDFDGSRGVFIAEGELVVRKLLASRFPIRSLLLSRQGHERLGDALATLPPETPVFVADNPALESIVGFPFHRGVLACGQRLPHPPLADLLQSRFSSSAKTPRTSTTWARSSATSPASPDTARASS